MTTQSKSQSTATEKTALCVCNPGYEASLAVGNRYAVIPDADATEHGYIRVVDESGEDYLYPASYFSIQ